MTKVVLVDGGWDSTFAIINRKTMEENEIIRSDIVFLENGSEKTLVICVPDDSIKNNEFKVNQRTLDNLKMKSGDKVEFTLLESVDLINSIYLSCTFDSELEVENLILTLKEYLKEGNGRPIYEGNFFEITYKGPKSDNPWINSEILDQKALFKCNKIIVKGEQKKYGVFLSETQINLEFENNKLY